MKAIVVKSENKEPRFVWEDVPDIKPKPDEVLVDIKATAVNRADLLQARGLYPPPPGESEILGLEMAGVVVYVTAGTASKLDRCRQLGASLAINYKEQDFVEEVMAATQGQGVELILDPVGGAYLKQNLNLHHFRVQSIWYES